MTSSATRRATLALLTALLMAPPVLAVDCDGHADADTIVVVTTKEDGTPQETTIWLLVLEGLAYIRTGATSWAGNLDRDPRLLLRVDDAEYPVAALRVEDEALFEAIEAGFREKYGFQDWFVGLMPGAGSRAYLLVDPDTGRAP